MGTRINSVLSLTALLVAIGGATPLGEAAYNQVVPRNSVGTVQLKRNAVTAAKIAPNAVRTAHVLNGSLLAADFREGQLPKGDKGDRGDMGERGPTGPAGATNVVVRRASAFAAGQATATANCNAGERAVGGGFDIGGSGADVSPFRSEPTPDTPGATPTGWTATSFHQTTPTVMVNVSAYVICAAP